MVDERQEPDYEGFVRHIEEWDANNVVYGLRDMARLAKRYGTPIPNDIWQMLSHRMPIEDLPEPEKD